ncbi:MAG: 2OG-Fe(II) oxygenase [Campylobacterales bacterium]|nr:2OG-Fe(II) oxygenase [Campylobacterales bacterium]
MKQISEDIFCGAALFEMNIQNLFLPNPYHKTPFLIIENFLSKQECAFIAKEAYKDECAKQAEVKHMLLDSIVNPAVDKTIRKTLIHKPSALFEELYTKSFLRSQSTIEAYFSAPLTTSTPLQVLAYKKGYFYIKHSDDSNEIIDKEGQTIGFQLVAPQRKITTVAFGTSHISYANSDTYHFRGGELVFNYLYHKDGTQVSLKPKAGDMIAFPSNPLFSHEVKIVEEGFRLTLVQWHNAIIS